MFHGNTTQLFLSKESLNQFRLDYIGVFCKRRDIFFYFFCFALPSFPQSNGNIILKCIVTYSAADALPKTPSFRKPRNMALYFYFFCLTSFPRCSGYMYFKKSIVTLGRWISQNHTAVSFHFISFHSIPFHFILFHFISFHFISFHSI